MAKAKKKPEHLIRRFCNVNGCTYTEAKRHLEEFDYNYDSAMMSYLSVSKIVKGLCAIPDIPKEEIEQLSNTIIVKIKKK